MHIDLNSDLGESYGAWKMGNDEQILSMLVVPILHAVFMQAILSIF
jgi:lactam utilization protein B